MPFNYLPVFVEKAAPKPARKLKSIPASQSAWYPAVPPVASAKVALLTSAAVRTLDQPPFLPPDDASYRTIPAEPSAADLISDHRSPLGTYFRADPEIIFPRAALKALAERGVVGSVAETHFSFAGGTRDHEGVENDLARGVTSDLRQQGVNLAVLTPF
jgi:D-proline reductase (dithiol) PrdB